MRDRLIIDIAKEDNYSYAEIADMFHLSRARVGQILVKNGVVRRPLDINPDNVKNREEYKASLQRLMDEA